MKFKRENTLAVIIAAVFMILFAIFDVLLIMKKGKDTYDIGSIIALTLFCVAMTWIVIDYISGTKYDKLYDKFKDGKKIEGYIVGTFRYRYVCGGLRKTAHGIKVLAENELYVAAGIKNNKEFKKIEKKLENIQVDNNIISLNKIPVGVYLKNDDYYVDIKNIKL